MPNQVYALFYQIPGSYANSPGLRGLFETNELAERALLTTVLSGQAVVGARIDVLPVEQPYDEANPLNYPDVIAELILQRKIQAIKNLRSHVDGLFLKEAKDAVEAVNLLELPESLRVEAQKLVEAHYATEQARRTRYQHKHDSWYDDVLVDGQGDKWVHIGEGLYVQECANGLLPLIGDGQKLGAEEIEERYDGINLRYDY